MFFLELPCFLDDPADVGNLTSGSSAFSKTSLNIWNFTVHLLVNLGLDNFEHYFMNMWDECNYAVVWAFFCISFLWNWNENWPFPVLWPWLSFPNFLAYWVQRFHSIIFQDLLDGCEFEWTLGIGDGQGDLVCCNSWGSKESDTIEWLNWTELNNPIFKFLRNFQTVFQNNWTILHSH